MRRFQRSQVPDVLTNHAIRIGVEYAKRRKVSPAYKFQWPQIEGQRLNHMLRPLLTDQTDGHCSYCDHHPLRKGDDSIDHFKPKTNEAFYELVCSWENLYIACKHCQDSKLAQYDDLLLRPDEVTYEFGAYFIYNYSDHSISPNPISSANDQQRAEITINIFDMNNSAVKECRRIAAERYFNDPNPVISDYNYRFIFE